MKAAPIGAAFFVARLRDRHSRPTPSIAFDETNGKDGTSPSDQECPVFFRLACIIILALTATAMTAAAQQTVFVIRHAEKEATGTDPALTPEGRNRAADWAVMLRSVGLDVVITSDARRTRETGGLIAEALGLPIKQLPRNDVTGHVDLLDFDHSEEIALIVAHTETIPLLLGALGVEESIDVDKNAFDNLFIVSARMTDHPVLTHLRMP